MHVKELSNEHAQEEEKFADHDFDCSFQLAKTLFNDDLIKGMEVLGCFNWWTNVPKWYRENQSQMCWLEP